MIALNTDVEIWPTSPLIFTVGVKKCTIWSLALWFRTSGNLSDSVVRLKKNTGVDNGVNTKLDTRAGSITSSSAVAEKPRCTVGQFWEGGGLVDDGVRQ